MPQRPGLAQSEEACRHRGPRMSRPRWRMLFTGLVVGVVQLCTSSAQAAPSRTLVFAGTAVQPGERKDLKIRVSQSYSASPIRLPFTVVRGKKPGPVLCLVAGIHGDELNGVGVVRKVMESLKPSDIRGTVIGLPIVNQLGFWAQSRYLPDRRDLNRHFPGSATGTTASRIAHRIWTEVLVPCTHVIDFHTGSLHRSNLPQVRGDLGLAPVMNLAHSFGAPVLVHNRGQRGTLRRALTDANVPAILYESGEAMRFQPKHVATGVEGTRRVMRHLGILREAPRADPSRVYLETHWVRAEYGGILEVSVPLGAEIEAGQLVGTITDPLNNRSKVVRSRWSGQVIGRVMAPTVLPGMAVIHVGVPNGRMETSEAESAEVEEDRPE